MCMHVRLHRRVQAHLQNLLGAAPLIWTAWAADEQCAEQQEVTCVCKLAQDYNLGLRQCGLHFQ
jgi:hypothetical protein